jgi:hypothetical protein
VSRQEAIDYVERDHGGDRRGDQQAGDPQKQSLYRSKHPIYFWRSEFAFQPFVGGFDRDIGVRDRSDVEFRPNYKRSEGRRGFPQGIL